MAGKARPKGGLALYGSPQPPVHGEPARRAGFDRLCNVMLLPRASARGAPTTPITETTHPPGSTCAVSPGGENLPGVQEALGVEHRFQLFLQLDERLGLLEAEVRSFEHADAVLPRER